MISRTLSNGNGSILVQVVLFGVDSFNWAEGAEGSI